MNFKALVLVGIAAFINSTSLMADEIAIAFEDWGNNAVPVFEAPRGSDLDLASREFLKKFGNEDGVRGTAVGSKSELVVLVSQWHYANQLWRKMLNTGDVVEASNGAIFRYTPNSGSRPGETCASRILLRCPAGQVDACTIPGANATHHFCTNKPSAANYQFLSRMSIEEAAQGQFYLLNGTPSVKQFMVVMEEKCGIAKAGVVTTTPDQIIEPTKLIGSKRVGGYSIGYEYAVNGGFGASLSSIVVTMARHGGPIVIDICPVDVYVAF